MVCDSRWGRGLAAPSAPYRWKEDCDAKDRNDRSTSWKALYSGFAAGSASFSWSRQYHRQHFRNSDRPHGCGRSRSNGRCLQHRNRHPEFDSDQCPGLYSFPALAAGHYEVRIRATGFQEYRQTGLVLDVNTAQRVDAALVVGGVSQEVNVTATSVLVETSNTQMGEVIGGSKMTTLPLNGRSYTDLLALQPGVAPASSGEGSGYYVSGNLNPGSISVSGQREAANGFMVNGGSAEEKLYNAAAIIPDLDSIAEFRILTNHADAEYGNYSGGTDQRTHQVRHKPISL